MDLLTKKIIFLVSLAWGSLLLPGNAQNGDSLKSVEPEIQYVHEKLVTPYLKVPINGIYNFIVNHTAGPKQPNVDEQYKEQIKFLENEIETVKQEISKLVDKPLPVISQEIERLKRLKNDEKQTQEQITSLDETIAKISERMNKLPIKTSLSFTDICGRVSLPVMGLLLGYVVARKIWQYMEGHEQLTPLQKKLLLTKKAQELAAEEKRLLGLGQAFSSQQRDTLTKLTTARSTVEKKMEQIEILPEGSRPSKRGKIFFYGLHTVTMLGGLVLGYFLATKIFPDPIEPSINEKNEAAELQEKLDKYNKQKIEFLEQLATINLQKPTVPVHVSEELWPRLVELLDSKVSFENYLVGTKLNNVSGIGKIFQNLITGNL